MRYDKTDGNRPNHLNSQFLKAKTGKQKKAPKPEPAKTDDIKPQAKANLPEPDFFKAMSLAAQPKALELRFQASMEKNLKTMEARYAKLYPEVLETVRAEFGDKLSDGAASRIASAATGKLVLDSLA